MKNLKFIDLFCGVGGFHQALSSFDYKCVFACDIDYKCREIYEKNYKIKPEGDITKIDITKIPDFDVLCAGFPCQPFSHAGFQAGFNDSNRGNLFFNICDIIELKKPKFLILENVKNLANHDHGNTWKTIYKKLDELGYDTFEKPLILNTLNFNVPQNRERVVILCKRKDLKKKLVYPIIKKIQPTCSIKDIIRDFEFEENKKYRITDKLLNVEKVWNGFIEILKENKIDIPKFPIWTDWWDSDGSNTKLCIKDSDLNSEENTENIKEKTDMFYAKYKTWIDRNRDFYKTNKKVLIKWLKDSRKNSYWKGSVRKLEWQAGDLKIEDSFSTVLWSARGSGIRVKRLDYTPTLVAMSMIPVYGPEHRILSPREVARLQSFPEDFILDSNEKNVYKQMGNAVNVKMAQKCVEFLIFDKDFQKKIEK